MASHYQSSGTVNWQATGTSNEGSDSEEDDGNFWDVDIREKECWLFDTASGCFYACNGRGGISIGQRPTCYGGWHGPGGVPDSGFVKDGSVIRMEYGGDGAGTIVIYVDGRRLGGRWEDKLVTGQDTAPIPKWPYGRFRWCGVVTYGAELRFSGPEIPYGWPSDRPHPSYLVPHGIFRR